MSDEADFDIIQATVFLTANIAFLAIPLVSSGRALNSSVAQVASYISVIASIGTLIAAPILITRETYTAAVSRIFLFLRTLLDIKVNSPDSPYARHNSLPLYMHFHMDFYFGGAVPWSLQNDSI